MGIQASRFHTEVEHIMKTRIIAVFLSALIIILLSINTLPTHSFASSVGGGANGAVVTGSVRIVGLPVNVILTGAAPVTLPPTGGSSTNQIASVTAGALGVNILQTGLIVNTTSGTVGSPTSHAESTSTVNGLNILGGLVSATTIMSKSTSDCNGQTATSTGDGLTVENLVVAGTAILAQPAPNTVIAITNVQINLLGIGLVRVNGTVTLNEQIAGGNGINTSSLTVNQVHVNVVAQALVGLARVEADVIVASASSSVSCDSVIANQCPTVNIAGGSSKTVQAGQNLSFQVSGTDPDGNQVTLTATNIPANGSFAPNPATGTPTATGTFNFTPSAGQANQTFTVNFTATDNNGCSAGTATPVPVQITVTSGPPPNECPLINVTGGTTRTAQVGDTVSFQVSATDPDGNTVTLTSQDLPANATFNPNPATGTPTASGTFVFTPSALQAGQTFSLTFKATDNAGCTSGTAVPLIVSILVTIGENNCPVITVAGGLNRTAQVGQPLTFQVSATDPDGNQVTLNASNLPPNASFSPNPATGTPTAAGTLTFTPSSSQAGQTFNINFTASDNAGCSGGVPIPVITSITVGGDGPGGGGPQSPCGNHAPMISVPPLPVVGHGEKLEFMVKANDEDEDDVTLFADHLPDNAEFNSSTGIFTFIPSDEQLFRAQLGQGIVAIFSATDSQGATARAIVDITPVASTSNPRPPVLSVPPGPILVKTVDRLSFAVAGLAQAASCAVTLSASDMLGGSTFSTSTNRFSLTPSASMINQPFLVNFTATDCAGRTREAAVRIIVIEANSNCVPTGTGIINVPITRHVFANTKVGDHNGGTTVSITNRGGGPLMINSLTLSDSNNYRLEGVSELPLTLQPGAVIEFRLFFEPKRKGAAPGVLTIFSSDATTPAYEIQLKGKGVN